MITIKKVVFAFAFFLTAIGALTANDDFILNDLQAISDDELVKAVYEVSLISNIIRRIPSTPPHPDNTMLKLIENFKVEVQEATTLLNFVCAQVYVAHLKDLRSLESGELKREDLDLTNYYHKNNLTIVPSLFSLASAKGAQRASKLLEEEDWDKVLSAHCNCMNHLESFLCSKFESSYRELFDIEGVNLDTIQNPYHSFLCHYQPTMKE